MALGYTNEFKHFHTYFNKSFKLITWLWAEKASWITLLGRKTELSEFFLHPDMKITQVFQCPLFAYLSILTQSYHPSRERRNPFNYQILSSTAAWSVQAAQKGFCKILLITNINCSLVFTAHRREKQSKELHCPSLTAACSPSLFSCFVLFLSLVSVGLFNVSSLSHKLLNNPSAKLGE